MNSFENSDSGAENVEGKIESGNEIVELEISFNELEQALDSVGGEEGLQTMVDSLTDLDKQNILKALHDEHESNMQDILREQERAGKMMDDGVSFIYNPKFVYQEGLKNDQSHDEGWAALKSALGTAAIFGSGANIVTGLGAGTVGATRHFISRLKELRENRRYENEVSGLA